MQGSAHSDKDPHMGGLMPQACQAVLIEASLRRERAGALLSTLEHDIQS